MNPLKKADRARVRKAVVSVGWQNLTEGTPWEAPKQTTVFAGCEVDGVSFRKAFDGKSNWRTELPHRDGKQGIAWDTDVWQSMGRIQSIKVHGSGQGDDSVPDFIQTPARWVHTKFLRNRETGVVVAFVFGWWINSWNPMGAHDHSVDDRRKLAMLAKAATERAVRAARETGAEVVLMGDFNSIRARLRFRNLGLKVVFGKGLDRMLRTKGLRCKRTWNLPVVGVGSQLKHKGLAASFKLKSKKGKHQ